MADQPAVTGAAPVTDHRPVPKGVLPRRFQTWLMAALALGIVLIILLTGQPTPTTPMSTQTQAVPPAPTADRLRDYQDRLRAMETRAAIDAQAPTSAPPAVPEYAQEPVSRPPEDPLVAERRRRDYESLFSSNVVLSRRSETERPDAGVPSLAPTGHTQSDPRNPSLDDVADAVIRATSRGSAATTSAPTLQRQAEPEEIAANRRFGERETPASTEPVVASAAIHRLLEGTWVDAVLTNRLDGSAAAPVNCLVTNAVYSHTGRQVVIPAGARILGETRPVEALGETRLGVAFHRVLMPDGRTYRLDQFKGMNQIGDVGLRDRVNQHYWSTFGAAGAVGLISGLAQWLGTAGFSQGSGERTVVIAGGAADTASQASMQVMNRFLNRLPTVTIREGHRVKVYLTSDLELPTYESVF